MRDLRRQGFLRLGFLPFSILGATLIVSACGGTEKAKPKTAAPDAGSSDAVIGAAQTFRPASSVAPMPMPNPPVFGSKIATTKEAGAWKRASTTAVTGRVDRDVATLARASSGAPAKKIASHSGKLDASAAPASHPLSVKAGHCYRVYLASKSGAVLTVSIIDSQGRVAIEGRPYSASPFIVAPLEGATCFEKDDTAEISVSLGLGDGDYALEVWSD